MISRAEGIYVYSPEGTRYIDFLSAYSAVNQGHGHPKLLKALVDQASQVTLTSRAFHNSVFPQYAKYVTEYFGYDMVLPMNTGAEGVETAIKLARKWGYMRKEIGPNQAIILGCADNFHGRTMTAVSLSTDPQSRGGFGPYLPGVGAVCPETGEVLKYGNVADLERFFRRLGKRLAGFLVEPIQGEAGIIIPPDEFLKRAYQLCNEHNVLFIADEIQTGIARTGKMLAIEHVGIRPDVLILGKALSGGMYPVSAVLADEAIMKCIQPGEHGSTYGGNPLACAVAMAALQIVKDENLVENAAKMGQKFRDGLNAIKAKSITTGKHQVLTVSSWQRAIECY